MRVNALTAALGAVLLGALLYGRRVEPEQVEVTQVSLRLPRLDPAFDGYRLVQISDIHLNGWMTGERLAGIVATVNRQQPDLVAITGDFVTNGKPYDPAELVAALRGLTPRDAAVAVLGNHDHKHSHGSTPVRQALRAGGVVELPNAVYTVRRDAAALHVAGVDDVIQRRARLDLVLAALPEHGAAILLAHEPDFADLSAATGRFDLQLSGHTHGGQVRLPRRRPLITPLYGSRYPAGHYFLRGMHLYTNRGLGFVSLRLRLNCRPEITVLTLRAGAACG